MLFVCSFPNCSTDPFHEITFVNPITADGKNIGYNITFAKGDPITIYHGQDGANGEDGADGQDGTNGKDGKDGTDGHTPVIGIFGFQQNKNE